MMNELKACPFCKVVPTELEFCLGDREYPDGKWDNTFSVCCTNPTCEAHGSFALTEEAAIEIWNK
jgi:hypothetical protein